MASPKPSDPFSPQARRWIVEAAGHGTQILAFEPLAGAISSAVYGLRAECHGQPLGLVLRLFSNAEWVREEPNLAAHEAALQTAGRTRIVTPALITFDEAGEHCGSPTVLMTRLPGEVDLRPDNLDRWLSELASAILPAHSLPAGDFPWRYRRYNQDEAVTVPPWSSVPLLWKRAIGILSGPPPPIPAYFIHRDYHPMNVLWQDGHARGIVDWVNGCAGPANIDVAGAGATSFTCSALKPPTGSSSVMRFSPVPRSSTTRTGT